MAIFYNMIVDTNYMKSIITLLSLNPLRLISTCALDGYGPGKSPGNSKNQSLLFSVEEFQAP